MSLFFSKLSARFSPLLARRKNFVTTKHYQEVESQNKKPLIEWDDFLLGFFWGITFSVLTTKS